jgi:hypothetical protein
LTNQTIHLKNSTLNARSIDLNKQKPATSPGRRNKLFQRKQNMKTLAFTISLLAASTSFAQAASPSQVVCSGQSTDSLVLAVFTMPELQSPESSDLNKATAAIFEQKQGASLEKREDGLTCEQVNSSEIGTDRGLAQFVCHNPFIADAGLTAILFEPIRGVGQKARVELISRRGSFVLADSMSCTSL